MNNGISEPMVAPTQKHQSRDRVAVSNDELSTLKKELLKAEVRLAKARAIAAGAEVDVKVLTGKLKDLTK